MSTFVTCSLNYTNHYLFKANISCRNIFNAESYNYRNSNKIILLHIYMYVCYRIQAKSEQFVQILGD